MMRATSTRSSRLAGALLLGCVAAAPALAEPTVGAYYYPWWGDEARSVPGGHNWEKTHRAVLDPTGADPVAGLTASENLWTIASHIDQSQAGNISLWVNSWWGQGKIEDRVLTQNILPHPHANRVKQAIFYESTGRLGDSANPNWNNLSSDFDYLAREVFTDPNYHQIDGKPAAFIYLTRSYFKTAESRQQVDRVRQEVKDNHGIDLYLVGDHVFGGLADGAGAFDAVTAYDVYGQSHKPTGGTVTGNAEKLGAVYAKAAADADALGVDLIPTVSPGYNDRQQRFEAGNEAAARYYEDIGPGTFGTPFADMINTSARPNTDADTGNLILVNSFNEWHEDTQIEALTGPIGGGTTKDVTGDDRFTQGKTYENYGTRYLDILRQLTGGPTEYAIFNGLVGDGNQDDTLSLEDIVVLGEHWSLDSSELTLREIARHGDWNLSGVTDQEDLVILVGLLNGAGVSVTVDEALALIPEPSGLLALGTLGLLLRQRR